MTLMELMVSIAILLFLSAAVAPSLGTALMLEQRGAARRLALTYEELHDDAVLRNKTYRIAFNLDEGTWQVEVADPNATVFATSSEQKAFEKRAKEKLDQAKEDRAEDRTSEIAGYQMEKLEEITFGPPEGGEFDKPVELPQNTRFKSVYTPQYEEPLRPRADDEEGSSKSRREEEEDAAGPRMAYSYIFANGNAEYTVIQLVDAEDREDGFTITVDPLSGRVQFHNELVDQHDMWSFLPEEGPRLEF